MPLLLERIQGWAVTRFTAFWWLRVMAALLHLISLTVNSHSVIYLWKHHTWTHYAMGGQITTTAMLIYDSCFKEMTVECAANWADMKYGPTPNLHNIAGQSNINKVGLLFMGCVCPTRGIIKSMWVIEQLQTGDGHGRWNAIKSAWSCKSLAKKIKHKEIKPHGKQIFIVNK